MTETRNTCNDQFGGVLFSLVLPQEGAKLIFLNLLRVMTAL